jgi:hypothetical protein
LSAEATQDNRSYRDVLRNRRMAGLLLGDLLANVGTGMIIVAMPVQTLSIHGGVPKAIAIGMVEAAPFVLSTMLALAIGLGRAKIPPRTLLMTDCVLRSLTFAALGLLAVTDRLTLPVLSGGLTLLLLPIAALAVLRRTPDAPHFSRAIPESSNYPTQDILNKGERP